jgi:hypothetical protein
MEAVERLADFGLERDQSQTAHTEFITEHVDNRAQISPIAQWLKWLSSSAVNWKLASR